MILIYLLLFVAVNVYSQQQSFLPTLSHPLTTEHETKFLSLQSRNHTSVPETLHVVAMMAQFQKDSVSTTTGDGSFDTSHSTKKIIDPSPHDFSYFSDHLLFAKNYFAKVSNGKLYIDYHLLAPVITLPKAMKKYSPSKTSTVFKEIDTLVMDAWHILDSLNPSINFSQFDSNRTVFIVFHAGVGRDVDLASTYGYDPRPFDIPTLYKSFLNFKKNFGNDFIGFPVDGGTYRIKNSIILPETESRFLPSSFGGDVFVQLGINGMICANIGSHLGLPDLFNTKNGRSGIGRFGLMDGEGIFAWNGFIPPEPSAWEKYFLGWVEPQTILSSQTAITLPAVSMTDVEDTIYRVPIAEREYFLVENRIRDAKEDSTTVWVRRDGLIVPLKFYREPRGYSSGNQDSLYGTIIDVDEFDWSLPGGYDTDSTYYNGGILLWHIDENVIEEKYAANEINADIKHRGVDVEQANGAQDIGEVLNTVFGAVIGSGSAFDFWFKENPLRVKKKFSDTFSPKSFPNANSNDGANSHISLNNFSERNARMTFDIHIGDDEIKPLAGFPKNVGEQFEKNSVRIADIDNDGENEILVVTNGDSLPSTQNGFSNSTTTAHSKLYAWNFDGTKVLSNGNVSGLFTVLDSQSTVTPTISTLNTTTNNILVANGNTLSVLKNEDGNSDGLADTLFIVRFAKNIVTASVTSDSVIAIPAEKGWGYFLRLDGSLIYSGHILHDSTDEFTSLYLVDKTNNHFYFSSKKGVMHEFHVTNSGVTIPSTVEIDLDKNVSIPIAVGKESDNRLVVATDDGDIYLLHSFVDLVPVAFRQMIDGFPISVGDSVYAVPVYADINGDGQRDIVVLSGTKIFAFNANGALLDYFPIQTTSTTRFLSQPLAADVDGNGSIDIVAVSQEGLVFAYDNHGKLLSGFPLLSGKNNGTTPAISLYQDTIALVVASDDGNVYAWKTGTVTPGLWKSEWTQYQHDAQGSGLIDAPLTYHSLSNNFFPKERAYNYPNPVYGTTTTIRYFLKENANVKIRIFDLAGDLVKEFSQTGIGGFDNEVEWNVSEIQSGAYFAHIEATSATQSADTIIKIAVVK